MNRFAMTLIAILFAPAFLVMGILIGAMIGIVLLVGLTNAALRDVEQCEVPDALIADLEHQGRKILDAERKR